MKATAKIVGWNWVFIIPIAFSIYSGFSTASASVQLISSRNPFFAAPTGGNGDSGLSIISPNGRFVLFASTANNLTLTNDNNSVLPRHLNVFLRDRTDDTTTLVSINLAGTGGGNGDSFPTGISTNGQFALFESSAADLVANDTNNVGDIFVRNLINGTTTLVSVSTNGTSGNGLSRGSVMTPDGRYIAFTSVSSNLVAGDTNNLADVFVRDLQTGTTTLASVGAATNSNPLNASSSESPEITPDGRYVAFYSTATNLVPGVTTAGEIYVRDMVAGNTIWASTNARAISQSVTGSTNVVSCNYNISDDGKFVAFETCTNSPTGSYALGIILRYGLQTGLTDIIYTNAHVPLLSFVESFEKIHDLAMTPDGRFTTFVANVGSASGTNTAIYLWDAQSGTSTLVSSNLNNSGPANGICESPAVSSNGQFVAFVSSATNLVTNTLAGVYHVYIRDMQAAVTQLLDTDTYGNDVGVNPTMAPTLSADGSVVTFESENLLGDNRQLNYDVFARDLTAAATDLISVHNPALQSQTPDGISGFTSFSTSSNGRFVAFYSDADNLAPNDANGCRDVFVRDLVAGTNTLVSVNTNGVSGDGISTDPAISAGGRYVAFTSSADDLVANDTNRTQDIFIRDLQSGATTLASISTDGIHPGNADSFSPQISANGRYVLFHSKASNLASGSFGGENLFFRDLQTGTTHALTSGGVNSASMTPDGQSVVFIGTATGISGTKLYVWNSQSLALTYTNSSISASGTFPLLAISANGQKVAYLPSVGSPTSLTAADLVSNTVLTISASGTFSSHDGIQFSSDGRFLVYAAQISPSTNQNVYLYDFQAGTNLLVSQNYNSTNVAGASSDSPSISSDGNFIAYRSLANDVVSNDFNNVADLFIYDRSNAATIVVSASGSGNFTANDRSLKPVFSGDSQTLFFQSWASDLAGDDFNSGSDLFALNLASFPGGAGTINSASTFYMQLTLAGGFGQEGQYPLISWPLISGKTYQVQFKNDLNDPSWQDLPGDITFIGDTGYITDSSPPTDKRFYRIVLNP